MIKSIAFVELNSIARGFETADYMVKAAAVELVYAKTVCPGKYIIMVAGDVAAVKASLEVGRAHGGSFVVDSFKISNLDSQVIYALNAVTQVSEPKAVGVVEYFSVAEAILGADTACKAADVELVEIRPGIAIGGKSFFVLTGSVSSVQSAVDSALTMGADRGLTVGYCVIPSPSKELYESLL